LPSPTLPLQSSTPQPSASPAETQPYPSSTVPPLGGQQTQPHATSNPGSPEDFGSLTALVVAAVAAVVVCLVALLRKKKVKA
jgi:hypothetical protein